MGTRHIGHMGFVSWNNTLRAAGKLDKGILPIQNISKLTNKSYRRVNKNIKKADPYEYSFDKMPI